VFDDHGLVPFRGYPVDDLADFAFSLRGNLFLALGPRIADAHRGSLLEATHQLADRSGHAFIDAVVVAFE
jgi:hypothetical protein